MMSEDHPLIGDDEVAAVFEALGGRGAEGIKSQNLRCNELAVKAKSKGVTARGRDHQPQSADRFAAVNGDDSHSQRAKRGNRPPDEDGQEFAHVRGSIVAHRAFLAYRP
jgi:hypothetical protein